MVMTLDKASLKLLIASMMIAILPAIKPTNALSVTKPRLVRIPIILVLTMTLLLLFAIKTVEDLMQ